MSVMIRWLPLVLYLNSSVILRAIYRILSSIEIQPDLNRSSAPIKISAAISTLNSMIVGWLVMNSTNLLGYLS